MIQKERYDALVKSLVGNVFRHERLHHYTSFQTILHILKSRKIRLSSLEKLKDPVEYSRLADDPYMKDKLFIFCLNSDEQDSKKMWQQYTPNSCGVRISLSPQDWDFLKRSESYTAGSDTQSSDFKAFSPWAMSKYPPTFAHVHYDDNLDMYITTMEGIYEFDHLKIWPVLVGMLKTRKYEYEHEVRIISHVNCNDIRRSIASFSVQNGYTYTPPPFKYLYCDIPLEILPRLEILFHPSAEEVIINDMKNTIREIVPNIPDENFKRSNLRFK